MPTSVAAHCASAEPAADLALDKQLCFALYLSANKVSRLYRTFLEPYGLTFSQYLALVALWDHAPCSVGHLCHVLDLESSTVTPLLKRMEILGFVSRTRDRLDERRVEIAVTAKGNTFKTEASAMCARLVGQVGLPAHSVVAIRTALQDLSAAIDERFAVPH